MSLSIGLSVGIDRSFSGQAAGGLSAPTLGYPSPLATNPSSIVVHLPVDWQVPDTLKLAYANNAAMTGATILTHSVTDTDLTNGTATIGLPTFSGINYLQGYGNHSGTDSLNKSGIVTWGDTTAPTITTAATASVVETLPLAVTLAATDTGGVPAQVSDGTIPGWCITGGADRLQFQIALVTGTPTLQWYNNGSQSYSSPKNYPPNSANPYVVQVTAIDYGGNKTNLTESVTVTQANLTPSAFSWTNQSGDPLSTLETAANTWTVAGMTAGVNAPLSNVGGQIRVSLDSGVTWTAWGSPPSSVQNGAQIQARVTSSSSYSTATTCAVTVGTATNTFTVTTMADPSRAGFTASTAQPAPINNSNTSNVWTFNSIDFIGGGYGAVWILWNRTISGVTIKGAGPSGADIALVQRATFTGAEGLDLWCCPDSTTIASTGNYNVVVTGGSNSDWVGIMPGTITNTTTTVPTGTATFNGVNNPITTTSALSISSTGVGVGFAWGGVGGLTAANGTQLVVGMNGFNANGNNGQGCLSRQITTGAWSPSFNLASSGNGTILAAMWG